MNSDFSINDIINKIDWKALSEMIMGFGFRLIAALFVIWIGFKIAKMLNKGIEKMMEKAQIDEMLKGFVYSLLNIVLKVLVFISAAGVLGVETSSFVALIAAAGLAIGMALSGTLQNFAGGVMILLLKPFKNGDYIEAGGYSGTVKDIYIFNTILITPDKKTVIIPNSDISNSAMINYSTQPKRRIDLQIGVSYTDDIDKVKKVLKDIAEANNKIIIDDGLTIDLFELGDNAVIFNYRFFVDSGDYWSVRREVMEEVKRNFDKKDISFPFPQRDIHIFNEN